MARFENKVPGFVKLLLAPVVGGIFVVLLPFIGIALFAQVVWEIATGSVRSSARDLAATLTPGWRPGEAHMTGQAVRKLDGELKAGGAGSEALEDLASEVSRRRGEDPGLDG